MPLRGRRIVTVTLNSFIYSPIDKTVDALAASARVGLDHILFALHCGSPTTEQMRTFISTTNLQNSRDCTGLCSPGFFVMKRT